VKPHPQNPLNSQSSPTRRRPLMIALAALSLLGACSSATAPRGMDIDCGDPRRPCDQILMEEPGRNLTPYIPAPGVVIDPPGGPNDPRSPNGTTPPPQSKGS
jgi:hypothetical protein